MMTGGRSIVRVEQRRVVAKVARLAIALLALAAASSCGGESRSPASSAGTTGMNTGPDSLAADRYLKAVEEFEEKTSRFADSAGRKVDAELEACSSLTTGHEMTLQDRVDTFTSLYTFLVQDQLEAKPFREYAEQVGTIETSEPALRTVARSVAVVADEARKVERANLNVCRELRAWARTGWSATYEHQVESEPYTSIGVNQKRIREAGEEAAEMLPALQNLGLAFNDALAIASSAKLFG